MKLFLTSAGIQPETKNAFLKLVGRDPKGMKVAFIPTAANHPLEGKKYVQISKDQLTELGFIVEDVDIEFFPKKELHTKLESCDVIYINGGNTFYLLDKIRKSGLDLYVKDLLKDKIYFGTSAGSIVACPNIEVCLWDGVDAVDPNIKDLKAFNLVPFTLFVHYEENQYKNLIEKMKKDYSYKLICLTNKQAVMVQNENWEIVGEGEKVIFD
jgi:dipeptidase E